MTGRPSERGYSLVELLASLVVLALIASMAASGVVTGRRVWEHSDQTASAAELVANAQGVLRGRLEHAFPLTRYDGNPSYADFQGAPQTVAFLAPPDDAHRPAALWRYQLQIDPSGNLVMTALSDLSTGTAPTSQAVLLRGVQSVDIAYYGAATPDNTPQWRSSWRYQSRLPDLVRVRVQFPDGDRRWWPDLIVHPAATIDSGCVLDTQTAQCRGRA